MRKLLSHAPHAFPPARPRHGFTILELLLVLLIMSITALLGMNAISAFEANQRADRGARESLAAFRFARGLAMTTGKKAKVVVNTAGGTISVYWQSNGTIYDTNPYTTGMTSTGTWVLSLNNSRELTGTTLSVTGATTGYTNYFEYNAMGSCTPYTGTVVFTYGGRNKSLIIASVGDPQIQ